VEIYVEVSASSVTNSITTKPNIYLSPNFHVDAILVSQSIVLDLVLHVRWSILILIVSDRDEELEK